MFAQELGQKRKLGGSKEMVPSHGGESGDTTNKCVPPVLSSPCQRREVTLEMPFLATCAPQLAPEAILLCPGHSLLMNGERDSHLREGHAVR